MSQLSLSFTSFDSTISSSLLVRDTSGQYMLASDDQILEAARRVLGQKIQRGAALGSPEVVQAYLRDKLAERDHEVFAVLLLNSQHHLIGYVEMFHGTIDQAAVYPREVVKLALKHNAAAMLISHNHPGGSPEPSQADLTVTNQLRQALALIDVRLLDHVIVAGETTTSFAKRGLL